MHLATKRFGAMKKMTLLVLASVLSLPGVGVAGEVPYIEFNGTMYGSGLGPAMEGLGAQAYTNFYDSVFTATSSNMAFFDGLDLNNLKLHMGDTVLGQMPSILTSFEVLQAGVPNYHDRRVYTGGQFSLRWQGGDLVTGGSVVDADIQIGQATGGPIGTVDQTFVAGGLNGANFMDELDSEQWQAHFVTFSETIQDGVGVYNTTVRLEPLSIFRDIQAQAVPLAGGSVIFNDAGVQFNFASATAPGWGGDEVTVEERFANPGGTLPEGVQFVDNGAFWDISTTLDEFTTDIEFAYDPEIFLDPESIVVVMRETSEDPWQIVASELVDGENRIRVLGQEHFSQWDLAQIPEPGTTVLWTGAISLGLGLTLRRRRLRGGAA